MAAVQNKPKVKAKGRGGNSRLSFWKQTKGFFKTPFEKNKIESSDSESQDYDSSDESESNTDNVSSVENLIAVIDHSPNNSYNLRSKGNKGLDSPRIHRSGAGISWQIEVPSAASTPTNPVLKPTPSAPGLDDIERRPQNCGLLVYDDDKYKMTNDNLMLEVKKSMQHDCSLGRENSNVIDNDNLGACGETKKPIDVDNFKERLEIMKLAYRLGEKDETLSQDEAITQAAYIRKQQTPETETNSVERPSPSKVTFELTEEETEIAKKLADKMVKENNMSMADALLAAIAVIKQRRQGAIPKLKDKVQFKEQTSILKEGFSLTNPSSNFRANEDHYRCEKKDEIDDGPFWQANHFPSTIKKDQDCTIKDAITIAHLTWKDMGKNSTQMCKETPDPQQNLQPENGPIDKKNERNMTQEGQVTMSDFLKIFGSQQENQTMNLIINLPSFSGNSSLRGISGTRFEMWIRTFESILEMANFEDRRKVKILSSKLLDTAAESLDEFIRANPENTISYAAAKAHLMNRFHGSETREMYEKEYRFCIKQSGESVLDYAHRLRKLFQHAYPLTEKERNLPDVMNMRDKFIRDKFISGLPKKLKERVKFKTFSKFEDLIQHATKYEVSIQEMEEEKKEIAYVAHIAGYTLPPVKSIADTLQEIQSEVLLLKNKETVAALREKNLERENNQNKINFQFRNESNTYQQPHNQSFPQQAPYFQPMRNEMPQPYPHEQYPPRIIRRPQQTGHEYNPSTGYNQSPLQPNTYNQQTYSPCKRCGKSGHYAKNCLAQHPINPPAQCYNCWRFGHFAKDCRAPPTNNYVNHQGN